MTVDTKGFVLTNKKDVFKVYEIIRKALVELMMEETGARDWHHLGKEGKYSIPDADLYENGCIYVNFDYNGEQRRLFVAFTCDSDYSDFRKGKKIILSLGCWGSSIHLMECALKALSNKFNAPAFIDEDDCDSVDWREVK